MRILRGQRVSGQAEKSRGASGAVDAIAVRRKIDRIAVFAEQVIQRLLGELKVVVRAVRTVFLEQFGRGNAVLDKIPSHRLRFGDSLVRALPARADDYIAAVFSDKFERRVHARVQALARSFAVETAAERYDRGFVTAGFWRSIV